MVTLGIDTATEMGSVGLAKGTQPVGELIYQAEMSQSEKLLVSVEKLLEITGVSREDLNLIAVSVGPGSFTGLRIGIATAKGLALSLNIPLIGIPTAESYRTRASFWSGKICVLILDRRNLVYQALFSNEERVIEEKSSPIEKVLRQAGQSEKPWLFVGSAVKKYKEPIKKMGGVAAPSALNILSGLTIAMMGQRKFGKEKQNHLLELEPLYAQRPVAELKFSE